MRLEELIAALTWRDVVDFALLFAIAYGVLRLLKGTRALPVLVLVAVLAAAGFLARELDLLGVGVLLEYMLEYIIIILIVVFHQELRRLLVRFGQRLLPAARREATQTAVEVLADCCERLARARVGALLILAGELDVLESCTDRGELVDAPLRAQTLMALTIPHPLNTAHDGAILIRDFHLERAGVVCPLSGQELESQLGTRHRGAIGVSEDSDALVIVLSEERGEIRVVEAGSISAALDRAALERRIVAWAEGERAMEAQESKTRELQLERSAEQSLSSGQAPERALEPKGQPQP